MFVATRSLSESLPDGSVVLHAEGDELERFPSWDYAVQKALRRLGYVAEREEQQLSRPVTPDGPKAVGLSCPLCPERTFVNHQGLRLHTTRVHGDA